MDVKTYGAAAGMKKFYANTLHVLRYTCENENEKTKARCQSPKFFHHTLGTENAAAGGVRGKKMLQEVRVHRCFGVGEK